MFNKGRKKKGEIPQDTAVITPETTDLEENPMDEQPVQEAQPMYQPQVQPQVQPFQEQAPQLQPQPAPVQQPIQEQAPVQPVQKQSYAYIKQAQVTEPGIFHYVIETNYPLGIGDCQLSQ